MNLKMRNFLQMMIISSVNVITLVLAIYSVIYRFKYESVYLYRSLVRVKTNTGKNMGTSDLLDIFYL